MLMTQKKIISKKLQATHRKQKGLLHQRILKKKKKSETYLGIKPWKYSFFLPHFLPSKPSEKIKQTQAS